MLYIRASRNIQTSVLVLFALSFAFVFISSFHIHLDQHEQSKELLQEEILKVKRDEKYKCSKLIHSLQRSDENDSQWAKYSVKNEQPWKAKQDSLR